MADLETWCSRYLTGSKTYLSWRDPIPGDGELVYRDGTACSASHVVACVYIQPDGTYQLKLDTGQARFTGDSTRLGESCETISCKTLVEVVQILGVDCSTSWAPTTCGGMIEHLGSKGKTLADFSLELVKDHHPRDWSKK